MLLPLNQDCIVKLGCDCSHLSLHKEKKGTEKKGKASSRHSGYKLYVL